MDFNKLFSLEGKVALVTGAAYGIGFAIAEAYAKAGAKIAFNCRSQHHMDQALADYKAKGIDAKGYICDVTDEEQVKNMVADIEKELGVIDILVNNAGIIKRIPMTEMSVDDFKQVIDIDLTAPFIVSKAVIPGMIKKGHGKIINICSMMSELGRETVSAYAAAKGGFICAKTPAGRWLDPEELEGPAVFLASEASNAVNGHILYVDGGILAYIGKQPK